MPNNCGMLRLKCLRVDLNVFPSNKENKKSISVSIGALRLSMYTPQAPDLIMWTRKMPFVMTSS